MNGPNKDDLKILKWNISLTIDWIFNIFKTYASVPKLNYKLKTDTCTGRQTDRLSYRSTSGEDNLQQQMTLKY